MEFIDDIMLLLLPWYIIMGESQQNRLLIVSYAERGRIARLISAREVTPAERKDYEEDQKRKG